MSIPHSVLFPYISSFALDELSQWYTSLDTSFSLASKQIEPSQLTGSIVSSWSWSDADWMKVGVSNIYHRHAIMQAWKQLIRTMK